MVQLIRNSGEEKLPFLDFWYSKLEMGERNSFLFKTFGTVSKKQWRGIASFLRPLVQLVRNSGERNSFYLRPLVQLVRNRGEENFPF